MRNLRRHIFAVATAIMTVAVCSGALHWEMLAPAPAAELSEEERIDIKVDNGSIYITVNRPVQAKVLTIVGQLIANDNLQPGTSRLKITAKGIYILKIGSLTKRISI